MKNITLFLLYIISLLVVGYICYDEGRNKLIYDYINSPVEEMYHKRLITTVDSILDSRFGDNHIEDVTEN